ncbi:hypothetical protein TBLA_0B03920 [Henningerozyma blattae CBS 6284]|uniref:Uncharacterized protein n=1 Tax=Henningerozyma blattae (strain ATCC 34711 / CBS 6284 / DSM 70876 / NBRC 10599 / NRRL Y-10934 / UCD 77-7) TaxID=1071380 RepID=I2GYM8_HENB6|nr:hypothetical protein TBLA_0B03920 [Tetrapisispora blattae CBS 6284]CCH59230.1 hypothetical protein TBLA_0B03920 [Tetrapisispora blattae CBS 6284]
MTKSHLIIVPCHGIWKSTLLDSNEVNLGQLPEHWYLAPFQYEGNDHLAFIKHSLRAIIHLLTSTNIDKSLLLFSGSQTKKSAGCISEAQSYYLLTWKLLEFFQRNESNTSVLNKISFDDEILSFLKQITDLLKVKFQEPMSLEALFTDYINTEEYSLDSFDNLIYSIYRFAQLNDKNYPTEITISGFGFKEKRFLKYHAMAIDYPIENITYLSSEPKPLDYSKQQLDKYFNDLDFMENKNALNLFTNDWYGRKEILMNKKSSRNPFVRIPNYQGYELFDLTNLTEDDEQFFKTFIKAKMPWSRTEERDATSNE